MLWCLKCKYKKCIYICRCLFTLCWIFSYCNYLLVLCIFPSRVSGRVYGIGPVCMSVCQRSHGWTVWSTDPKFGGRIYLDNISDEFEGQGPRSKVKVAMLENVNFRHFWWEGPCRLPDIRCHVMSHRDVMTSHDVITSRDVTPWRHGVSITPFRHFCLC